MRRIACILGIVGAIAAMGCASDAQDSPSTTSSSGPGDAVLHRYPEQGFSIAFGPSWHAYVPPEGSDWHLDITPIRDQEVTPGVGVTVTSSQADLDPLTFQRHPPPEYQRVLDGIAPNVGSKDLAFAPVDVNGVPALMASYYDGSTYNSEWYLLADGRHVYSLEISGSRETWATEAPELRAIVQSFRLLR